MKKLFIIYLISLTQYGFSQNLYVPGGSVGTSTNGYVGIGTNNPSTNFDVRGHAVFKDGNIIDVAISTPGGKNGIVLSPNMYGNYSRFNMANYDNSVLNNRYFEFRFNEDANGVVIRNGGHVGIGTTSPTHLLSLKNGSVELYGSGENSGIYSTNHYGAIKIYADGNSSKFEGARIEGLRRGGATDQSMSLSFFINSGSNLQEIMRLNNDGNIGIGTTTPQSKLAVNGQIRATEVKVLADISVPDYVFEPDYKLRTLQETKEYITENKHLPEIPSASEIGENGIDLGDMNMRLLKKIEELTLYQIELLEKLEQQNQRMIELETSNARIDELEKKLLELTGTEK